MRGRTILLLLMILGAMAAVAFLVDWSRRKTTTASSETIFPKLKTELVDEIVIHAKGKETRLVRRDEKWRAESEGGFLAEPKPIEDILERFPKFFAHEVVSTNPVNQSLFMVDTSGVEVWVRSKGTEMAHFFVGKPGADWNSTYVRAAGSDNVILVPEYMPSLFDRGESWRERTVFSAPVEDVVRYAYSSPSKGSLSVRKDTAGAWKFEEPDSAKAETSRVTSMVRAFCNLKAAGFEDAMAPVEVGIEPDTATVTAELIDGTILRLVVGADAPAMRRYARRDGSEQIVTIPVGAWNTMSPIRPLLAAKPPEH